MVESGFVFHDENKNLVRVKVKDCLDERKLGYVYQDVDIPWSNSRPTPLGSRVRKVALAQNFGVGAAHAVETSRNNVKFPVMLNSVVTDSGEEAKEVYEQEEEGSGGGDSSG